MLQYDPKKWLPQHLRAWHRDREHPGPPVAMLYTCRQTHNEALDALCLKNTFEFQLVSYPPIDRDFYEFDEYVSFS